MEGFRLGEHGMELFRRFDALEVIQGAGHFPWKCTPDRYWPLLIEFVTTAWAE